MTSKYHSKKVVVNKLAFDSNREYNRFCELTLLERAGKISHLQRQVRYTLVPKQKDPETGRHAERAITYIADFVYEENGKTVVEDVKGYRTKDYIMKRKLMLYLHGIRIREV